MWAKSWGINPSVDKSNKSNISNNILFYFNLPDELCKQHCFPRRLQRWRPCWFVWHNGVKYFLKEYLILVHLFCDILYCISPLSSLDFSEFGDFVNLTLLTISQHFSLKRGQIKKMEDFIFTFLHYFFDLTLLTISHFWIIYFQFYEPLSCPWSQNLCKSWSLASLKIMLNL